MSQPFQINGGGGGSATPGGSSGDIQYNNAGTFGGVTKVPPANGGTADCTAAGSGFFWSQTVYRPAAGDLAATGAEGTGNVVYLWKMVLPFTITVRSIQVKMAAATVATFDVGIYDSAGTRLISTGGLSANSTAIQTSSITPVTLTPGLYYYAMCGSVNSLNYTGIVQAGFVGGVTGYYTAANAATSGVLPSATGALTPVLGTGVYPAVAVFFA